MKILPLISILFQCLVETKSNGIKESERSLLTECLSIQKTSIIIYCGLTGYSGTEYVEKVEHTLRYLIEMLLKRSTCFKLALFSQRTGTIVELKEDVLIEDFGNNEHLFHKDDFSTFFDQLPTFSTGKHTLFYMDLLIFDLKDAIQKKTTQLKVAGQVKGYDIIFLCINENNLCLLSQWIPPNRFLLAGSLGPEHVNNMYKELLGMLKNPNFDRLGISGNLELQKSSKGECKIQMYFWMNFFAENENGSKVCSQAGGSRFHRLRHFFYQKFSQAITVFDVYVSMGSFNVERLNGPKGFTFGQHNLEDIDLDRSKYDFRGYEHNRFNNQSFCNIHIEIVEQTTLLDKNCDYKIDERVFRGADLKIKVLIDESDRSFVKKDDGTIVIWERDLDSVEFKAMLIEEIRNVKCANGCQFV